MIKYADLVTYIKDNHVNWNTDLFEVLRGFFEQYSNCSSIPEKDSSKPSEAFESTVVPDAPKKPFKEPENGEYDYQDVLNLFDN